MSDTPHHTTITEHDVTEQLHGQRVTYFIVQCVCGYQSGALWSRQQATREAQDHLAAQHEND